MYMSRSIRWAGRERAGGVNRRSGTETEIGDHGANHHEPGDGERGQDAGPEAHTVEGHEERALLGGDVEAEFFRKDGANGDGEDESASPHNRDSDRQLKSLHQDIHDSLVLDAWMR